MRWRLIVLGVLAITLAVVTWLCVRVCGEMFADGQQIYTTSGGNQPSQKVMDAATRLFQTAAALQQLVTPLATGAILSGLAVLLILARRWQLLDARRPDEVANP